MQFFDREEETRILINSRQLSRDVCSQLTVLTGRRRIGKTKLMLRTLSDASSIYWFVSRSHEAVLASEFAQIASNVLGIRIPQETKTIPAVFEMVMQAAQHRSFTLMIDEFQELESMNPAIFGNIQNIWDRWKDKTHLNLVVSGSMHSMMKRIFLDASEPLYGRSNQVMTIRPFRTEVLKSILSHYAPNYSKEDLLALYAFTGSVPKYVELLMDQGRFDKESMIDAMTDAGSPFLSEGQTLLSQEFGRQYGTYFSILALIAQGKTRYNELLAHLGGDSVAGQLKRLEEEYELIEKVRPFNAKPTSQSVRFAIRDPFLRFWFRFMYKNRFLIEQGESKRLASLIGSEYTTYSGLALEEYFRRKTIETGQYIEVSRWWRQKAGEEQSEIDMVALELNRNTALVAEIKRQPKEFREKDFLDKVDRFRTCEGKGLRLTPRLLSMDDM